jgi:hypothetical protein
MSGTGLSTFDETIHVTNQWLHELRVLPPEVRALWPLAIEYK